MSHTGRKVIYAMCHEVPFIPKALITSTSLYGTDSKENQAQKFDMYICAEGLEVHTSNGIGIIPSPNLKVMLLSPEKPVAPKGK